ncbi:MAG: RNB domain-containing ribonuclease [Treponemataceae bacterium]
MKVGLVVLYKGQLAIITEISEGKIFIEGVDKKTLSKKVREKDVFVLSEKPVKSLDDVLNAKLPEVDFSIACEFFPEVASFEEIAELFYVDLKPEQVWKAWDTISSSPYFETSVPPAPIKVRSSEDLAKIKEKEKEKAKEAIIYKEFIANAKKLLQAHSSASKNTVSPLLDDNRYSKFIQEIEQLSFGKIKKSKILVDLKTKQTQENAHELLLKLKVWTDEKNPYPQRFEVSPNDAKAPIEKPKHDKPFTDLTHLVSYAIDNPGSSDPDDAICLDGETLYIHVACPAETVKHETVADEMACDRGSTLYLPEQVGRMLNEKAIEYFALGLEEECFALSFAICFDENFEPNNVEIFRSKIKVERLTYEEAENQKEGRLKPLFEISRKLNARRIKNGAISISMPEVFVNVTKAETANQQAQSKIELEPIKTFEASEMIREMMLLAGEAGAMFAFKNQIPFQYISQEQVSLPTKLSDGLAGEYQKRKSMRSRVVSTVPSKHFALGLSMYAQLTSPLRRYADLISQQQILRFIDGETLIDRDVFLERLSRAEIGTGAVNRASRLSRTHWILAYLARNTEQTFEATVLEITGHKAYCVISSLAFETDIHIKKERQLNETFLVKISSINLAFQNVVFVEA